MKSQIPVTLCKMPAKVVSDLNLACMHGLCCSSLIHLLVDPFISSPVRLASSWQYREYLQVDQGSLSYLINSLSHSHGSMWPEADLHWQYFTTNHSNSRAKSSFGVLFSVFTSWDGVVTFHYQGPGSAQQRDRCCQHRDSFAALASAFCHGHMWVAGGCGCHRL